MDNLQRLKIKKSRIRSNPLSISLILLLLLYIFHAWNNIAILKSDRTPITADATFYYQQSIKFFRILSEDNKGFLYIWRAFRDNFRDKDKPPLFAFSIVPWYFLFGVHPDIACLANLFFLAVALLSIFFIGRHFSGDYAGLLAAFILTTYPIVFGLSRWCMPYFATLSMVSLTVLLLIKSKGFSDRRYSLLSGFTAGLTALIHMISLFSLFVPYVFFFLQGLSYKDERYRRKDRYVNFLLSGSVLICLILIWMILSRHTPYTYMAANNNLPRPQTVIHGLARFMNLFLNAQLHWFYVSMFIIAGIVLAYKKFRIFLFLCAWYILHTLIVSFFPFSLTPRFNIASLSAIALITSLGIFSMPWRMLRRALVGVIVLFGIFQYFIISYYPFAERYYPYMSPLNREVRLIADDQVNHYGLLQANKTYWHQKEILSLLLRDNPKETVTVWIIYGKASIRGALLTSILEEKLPIEIVNAATDDRAQSLMPYSDEELVNDIVTADYILTYKDRVYDASKENWSDFLEKAKAIFYQNIDRFREVGRLDMPDGNVMYIYKNIS